MTCSPLAYRSGVSGASRRALLATLSALMVVVATPVLAGVGVGVAPTYPGFVTVGDTKVPVSLTITNVSSAPENGGTLTLNSIFFTASCGSSAAPCPAGDIDLGVFEVVGPAVGASGNACTGKTFSIGAPDASGELAFTAQGGSAVLQPPGTANDLDKCVISFFVNVLKLPTKDASGDPGVQTNAPARVSATASFNGSSGTGSGAATTLVLPVEIRRPAPALSALTLATIAVLLGVFGMVRARRREAVALLDRQRIER